ncbi:alanine racemase [Caulobacter mirabilis]|uniref:Alanine racemase n=1 Tax=Caulobacter mirabilis TaxID=69666 RepID=A0A2D2B063_9CAUL|nr:alanine racemase [Caulobacter mirabilis]ATQ43643.1 alanine racemase [Caulobacter mirabilis]
MPCTDDRNSAGRLTVDLDALVRNYRAIAARTAPVPVAAVVKADAYGLGAAPIAAALAAAGCRHFFVAHLLEARRLKDRLPNDADLFVLNGLTPGAEAEAADLGVIPVLNTLPQVRAWTALAAERGGVLPAAIQLDSGMSRLGLAPAELDALLAEPVLLSRLDLRLVMSHLACGDAADGVASAEQLAAFLTQADRLPTAPRSLSNSAGSFLDARFHFDLVRPGLALYGAEPHEVPGRALEPVVSLQARIIQLREVPAGARIGYGYSFEAPRPMRLATIGIGYADGWPRALSNRGAAWRGEARLPIVGRVSMDSTILDISALPADALVEGDDVELIGLHQSLDAVAAAAGSITHEILTGLGPRLHRSYHGTQS